MEKAAAHWPMSYPQRPQEGGVYSHQVKNLMAIVRAVAARTAEGAQDLTEFSAHFDARLAALARTQHMLSRAGAFEIDLEELVREELLAQGGSDATVQGPGVRLSQKAAETLGLALHELATNAVKFGALGDGGQVSVRWRLSDDWLILEWREKDVPAVDSDPRKMGFGRDWIEHGLPYQIGAQTHLEFLPGGVACTIRLPLAHCARAGDAP